jgi:hypothetical protein
MPDEVEFWRQDPVTKAETIVREVEQLARRARAADLLVTAYILEMALEEARRDVRTKSERGQRADI